MVQASLKYNDDPQLLLDIISAMPKRVNNALTLYRNKLLGNIPKTREEFDPTLLLSKVEGGDKVLVFDSSKDLPEFDESFRKLIRPAVRKSRRQRKNIPDDVPTPPPSSSSDEDIFKEKIKKKKKIVKRRK